MEFALSRYDFPYHINLNDPPPISGAVLEERPFGVSTPFDMRPIWIMNVSNLDTLLNLTKELDASLTLSYSPIWSGKELQNPGRRLPGISFRDDPRLSGDHRNWPARIQTKD